VPVFRPEVCYAVPDKSARRDRHPLSPRHPHGGHREGAEGPALPAILVRRTRQLGLAYTARVARRQEQLWVDIAPLWKRPLIVGNRPGRPRDRIGADAGFGVGDLEAYGQLVLANPDLSHGLKTRCGANEADPARLFGAAAPGYTGYPALEAAHRRVRRVACP